MSSVNIEGRLYDEIGYRFEDLHETKLGSEERKAAFNELDRMYDKAIELERIEAESRDKAAARESEKLMKEQQAKLEKRDVWIKVGVETAKFVFTALVTVCLVNKTLKFEETGTVTTMAGRNIIQRGLSFLR